MVIGRLGLSEEARGQGPKSERAKESQGLWDAFSPLSPHDDDTDGTTTTATTTGEP